jgi:hypothetical protein
MAPDGLTFSEGSHTYSVRVEDRKVDGLRRLSLEGWQGNMGETERVYSIDIHDSSNTDPNARRQVSFSLLPEGVSKDPFFRGSAFGGERGHAFTVRDRNERTSLLSQMNPGLGGTIESIQSVHSLFADGQYDVIHYTSQEHPREPVRLHTTVQRRITAEQGMSDLLPHIQQLVQKLNHQ